MKEMSEQYLESKRHGTHLERIAATIIDYGDIDGAHHKQWVLDQCLKLAAGEAYTMMTAVYLDLTGREWDTGIAP